MFSRNVPIHLDEQESLVWGLKLRQLVILGIGGSFGYVLADFSSVLGFLPMVLLPLLAVVVAFVRVNNRPLEKWALVGFYFVVSPKIYLHRPAEDEPDLAFEQETETEKDKGEIW